MMCTVVTTGWGSPLENQAYNGGGPQGSVHNNEADARAACDLVEVGLGIDDNGWCC